MGDRSVPQPREGAGVVKRADSYRTADLPQNLTQYQRDYFGAHKYQRNDAGEDALFVHSDWD